MGIPVDILPIKAQHWALGEQKSDLLQGTLDLMVLKTLEFMGPLHGYGIARRIEDETENWERIAATMARFLAPSN
jgi:hypothetical protein